MKLVAIEWVDSCQPTSPWQMVDDYQPLDPVKIFSVGFLLHGEEPDAGEKPSEVVALAPNVGNLGTESCQVSGVIHIPRCAIIEITDLERASQPVAAEQLEEQKA